MFGATLQRFQDSFLFSLQSGNENIRLAGKLVDILIKDIQHLEAECVRARYQISKHLDAPEDEYYRSNILSGLRTPYYDSLAYQAYMALYYDGGDPLSFKEWTSVINRPAKGHKDDRV